MNDPQFARELRQAVKLSEDFSGHEAVSMGRVKAPTPPRVAIVVGYCDGLLYSAVRDGKMDRYIHTFAHADRPLFLVTPNGLQLMLYGGNYDFTERGIVDRSKGE
jgi:hypothetical protein